MAKLTTDNCQKWLAKNSEIQQLVKDRFGWTDDPMEMLEMADYDQDEVDYINKSVKRAAIAKNWKRQSKYSAGGEHDMDHRQYGSMPECQDGIIREFELSGTDSIRVVILEKDGKLSFLDDLSD